MALRYVRRVRRRRLALLGLIVPLAACATVSRETVTVPVPVQAAPPPALLAPVALPLPVFVAPAEASASSCLTPEGERRLKALLLEYLTRTRAWAAWATSPDQP